MNSDLTQAVLDYWHCVEFFNHYKLDDQIQDARDDQRQEFSLSDVNPNQAEWALHEGKERVIYLLPFDVSQITELTIRRVGQSSAQERQRDEEFAPEGWTCFAKLRLSEEGKPDFKSLSLSTLPWTAGMVAQGQYKLLCASSFEESVTGLKNDMESAWSCRTDAQCSPTFIGVLAGLLTAWADFRPEGGLLAWIDVKKPQPNKPPAKAPPLPDRIDEEQPTVAEELPILNSFYYHDLKAAARAMRLPGIEKSPLARYLAGQPVAKLDLESAAGQQAIHGALAPARTNPGRWPAEPAHQQSLMQQFALNQMRQLQPGELLSVNGPPGTGKTTLIKDLIADLIVERGRVLASLSRPSDGVGPAVDIAFGNDPPVKMPTLLPALTGFEIVVASSNNGAVENLSLELPQLKGIAGDYQDSLRHFAEVATKYAGTQTKCRWKRPEPPVWGLISAALGNAKNRRRFQQSFAYTSRTPAQPAGDTFLANSKVDLDAWDAEGAMTYWRFLQERKPVATSFASAKRRWLAAHDAYDQHLTSQTALRETWLAFIDSWERARHPLQLHADIARDHALTEELNACLRRLRRQLEQRELTLWPGQLRWLMRWFSKHKFHAWLDARSSVLAAAGLLDDLAIIRRLQQTTGALHLWDGKSLASKRNQETALWHGRVGNALRNELFAASMELHQAFVLEAMPYEAAKAISNVFNRRPSVGKPLLMWQWLFMLVPVISSTFASVHRQFQGVDAGGLGWLVIDEAGQAVPHAAVGALLRAQRAVAVGDPLQIEPVVGIPGKLLRQLGTAWLGERADYFSVSHHSVQTLADRAHPYGVRHPLREQDFIGIPLVMHRRCDQPMFTIANQIAYRERMLHAKTATASAHPILGKSDWWDVKGKCTGSKYVPEQGQLLLERLAALYIGLAQAGGTSLPKAYVITPFREVKKGLLELLLNKAAWAAQLAPHGLALPDNLGDLRSWIGTVHTFQGKETDIVFFVLGCDEERGGAMDWAARSPNLLNVALTRAKTHCYVIGDKSLWGGLGSSFPTAVREYALFNAR